MKSKWITVVKHMPWLYKLYFYLFGFLINVLKIFVSPDESLILMNSFGGKKYDDSPKALYEAMISDRRFKRFKIKWAFHEPEKFVHLGLDIVKTDTVSYFITALKAGCWVSNSSIERGLNFKGKKTFYFNTWHGTPIKKMGSDIADHNESFRSISKKSNINILTVQSDFEAEIFSKMFSLSEENLLKCGLPRNDILVRVTSQNRQEMKDKLGLSEGKKVILYAPTFREFERDTKHNCVLLPPMDLQKWENILGNEYCLLFRAHYEVAKGMDIFENDFVKDMSSYPSLSDLMIAADVLISDYSSIFFDFSLMDKPMLHFTYDYDEYAEKRGMYFDIRNFLSGGADENALLEILTQLDVDKETEKTKRFREKYVNYYGNAVQKSLDCIAENIC